MRKKHSEISKDDYLAVALTNWKRIVQDVDNGKIDLQQIAYWMKRLNDIQFPNLCEKQALGTYQKE
jgi:hypothetical protein|uniref:Uncharacterized protein n=1 Tax=uncultured Caudovirales phage TaxID=2100421 RepID=A0A6J5KZR5_9CAUD|nr:hypothetical protein UFOVP88_61 [uncultured Caudovirales phage]